MTEVTTFRNMSPQTQQSYIYVKNRTCNKGSGAAYSDVA
jgi:hypothetical protein